MADFPTALNRTLKFEGSSFLQNEKTGEVSRYGVTAKFLASIGLPHSVDDVRALTLAEVTEIYQRYFWNALCCSSITDQTLANHVFDIGVNQGVKTCAFELQEAANKVRSSWSFMLTVDGRIGFQTLNRVNGCDATALLKVFRLNAAARYRLVAAENPNLADNLEGWLDRLYS